MPFSLGIDVGTTFTSAAVWRDERVEIVAVESHRVTVPSVIFAEGDTTLFGTAAGARGLAEPVGMAREFKRRLGDSVPIMLSGSPYSADRLVALFARWVVDSVSEQFGERPVSTVVTHPANWTEFQLHLLSNALGQVGLGDAGLLSEPQAAAHDFGTAARLEPGQLVLVYDLGGGTFDVALLRREQVGFVHVGAAAGVERLGGIDFDEAVFHHVIGHIPQDVVAQAREDPAGRMALAQVRRACIEAKESLSSSVSVEVPVVLPGHSSTVRLTRGEFEDMIRPMLRQTIDLSRQVLASANLTAQQLSAILLVGGSSRIPLVSELVRQETDATVRIDAHPKLVVARGAARWAGEHAGAKVRTPRPARAGGHRRARVVAAAGGALAIAAAVVLGVVLTRGDDDETAPTTDDTSALTAPETDATGATTAPSDSTSTASEVTSGPTDATTEPTRGNGEPNGVGSITRSSWSGDGLSVAIGSDDGTVRTVDLETGETQLTLEAHAGAVTDIAFNRGRVLTTGDDGIGRVWDSSTGDEIVELTGHSGPITLARWNGPGTEIATGSADGTVRIWDVSSGETLATLEGDDGAIVHLAWSRDDERVVTVSDGDTALIWDATSAEVIHELSGHTGAVTDAAWSPDGATIATASADGTARLWDAETGDHIRTFPGHSGAVLDVGWNPTSNEIATASVDGTVRLWDASTGVNTTTIGEEGDPAINVFSWSRDFSVIATGAEDGAVALWDAATGENRFTLTGHTDAVTVIVWSDEDRIATTSDDGTSRVWDAETGEELLVVSD